MKCTVKFKGLEMDIEIRPLESKWDDISIISSEIGGKDCSEFVNDYLDTDDLEELDTLVGKAIIEEYFTYKG